MTPLDRRTAFDGLLVGTAVGDALGLPREGLTATHITHTDPAAEAGALAVALAARHAVGPGGVCAETYLDEARVLVPSLAPVVDDLARCLADGRDAASLAVLRDRPGFVSGWVVHTVPAALRTWLRHPRAATPTRPGPSSAPWSAPMGAAAIPEDWRRGIVDWPRGPHHLARMAAALAGDAPVPRVFWPAALGRNLIFLTVVLGHGLRRLVPV